MWMALFWCTIICIGSIFELMFQLGKLAFRIVKIISSIPGQNFLKGSFRLSAIIAVVFVVVANRLSFFYIMDETLISITEFISSTILIPIIIEWIYSYSKSKNKSENVSS